MKISRNKGERNEIAQRKFKQRCQVRKLEPDPKKNGVLKHHSTPCSCWYCQGEPYNRKVKYKHKLFE